jgi:hypothetical protein
MIPNFRSPRRRPVSGPRWWFISGITDGATWTFVRVAQPGREGLGVVVARATTEYCRDVACSGPTPNPASMAKLPRFCLESTVAVVVIGFALLGFLLRLFFTLIF